MHRHKAQIILDWFLEHDNEFTLIKWPPQSPDNLWHVVEREIRIMDVVTSRNAVGGVSFYVCLVLTG